MNPYTKLVALQKDHPIIAPMLVFAAAALTVVWRFAPLMPSVFYGDDLNYLISFLDGRCGTRAADLLTTACQERFRPVAAGFIVGMMHLFGDHLSYYLAMNVALQSLAAALVFAISQRLTRGNWLASLAITLAAALSRFAAMQVTQVIGPVESLPLLLTLGAVYAVVRADQQVTSSWRWSWLALLFCFLATYAHERYMVLAVWLGMAFLLLPSARSESPRRLVALLTAAASVPVFYIAYKTFVLHAYFLIGTGGTHLSLDVPLILAHAGDALLSIFGFNHGPNYLVGIGVSFGWNLAGISATVFAVIWASLLIFGLATSGAADCRPGKPWWKRAVWPFLLLVLAGFLVAPALLTVRLEQRWLYLSFILVLLVAAWATGRADEKNRWPITVLTVLLSAASVLLDSQIMRHFQSLFFVSSPQYAALVKRDIVDKYPHQTGAVALLADPSQCSWTLLQGKFFRIYGNGTRPLYCFRSLGAAAQARLPADTHVYAETKSHRMVDLTNEWAQDVWNASHEKVSFNFLTAFAQGHISDRTTVSSPTGQGALKMPWNAATGGKRDTLTVISGFSYRYDDVPIAPDAQLRFSVAMVYPSPQPARALVRIGGAGHAPTVIFSRDLTPPTAGADLRFEQVTIPLQDYAGQHVSISFAVESPFGTVAGHWVGFADPRITLLHEEK